MAWKHGAKREALIPFEEDTTKSLDLANDRFISGLDLSMDANVVKTGGSASGTVVQEGELKLFPRIEIIGNGQTILFRSDAQGLYHINQFDYGVAPEITVQPDGAADTDAISWHLSIPFINHIGVQPLDTILNAKQFRTLQLVVQMGNIDTALFEGSYDRAGTISTAFGVRPTVYESAMPVGFKPSGLRIRDYLEKEVTATSTSFKIDIDTGSRIYQRFFFKTLDANSLDSDIINTINLITAGKFYHIQGLSYDEQRRFNMLYTRLGEAGMPTGCLLLPMTEGRKISTGLNVANLNSAHFDLDVTVGSGTSLIRVYQDYIIYL